MTVTLFRGGSVEVAAGPDGRILAAGPGARAAAGRSARILELEGAVLPGLHDVHVHLGWLAQRRLGVELSGTRSLDACLGRVRRFAERLPAGQWVRGRGWYNDLWEGKAFPDRHSLDAAVAGRPAFLVRKDGHSAWLSTAALRSAGITSATPDPPGGVIDREPGGEPTGVLRETAVALARRAVPEAADSELDAGMAQALRELAALGLTSIGSMDRAREFASLQRLHARARLPVRVTYQVPAADLDAALRTGISSGFGDDWLRVWGVKAFLDGSLGSRTADMLDGRGVATLEGADLQHLVERAATGRFNVALHAIGDRAVRRALDALEPWAGAWGRWRPRIEHAQCVDPADLPRFARAGAIASMQPIHAVADRELADREWEGRTQHAYAWGALHRAGARLAFGSDAPVETADPLAGLDAATGWRRRVAWHPDLALTRAQALRAYTNGAAYAAGTEDRLGRLRPGFLCDLTVVRDGRVTATVAGGRFTFRSPR